jgi:hypothetical protein
MSEAVQGTATPFMTRVIRAAQLDSAVYEEVEADRTANGQALALVILSGLAAGIGILGYSTSVFWVVLNVVVALLGWVIWAAITYWVGTKWLPEPQTQSDMGELLRTLGFSSGPGLIRLFGAIPGMSYNMNLALYYFASIWMLVAMVIAVRQALDYTSTWRALGVCLIGWTVIVFIPSLTLFLTLRSAAS